MPHRPGSETIVAGGASTEPGKRSCGHVIPNALKSGCLTWLIQRAPRSSYMARAIRQTLSDCLFLDSNPIAHNAR
ncbi:hypothetical protein ACET3X_005664 [Alternaria dauci]|uniref:Uncharacterized protein n=1 Tax=Alternaria dauci TaxID=48095 RepID=A0ABR3UHI5_9PLEO